MIMNKVEQQGTRLASGGSAAASMEDQISLLKGQLEEKLQRPNARAHWRDMVEDCQIILNCLEAKGREKARRLNAER
jgi:hypothetical protein